MSRLLLVPLVLATLAAPLQAQTAGPAPTQALTDEVMAADAALFSAFFDRCDIPALSAMLADDFEMIHDKGGRIAGSKAEMIASFEKTCARQKTGEDYRARRELVAGSLKVYPVNNYGAIEIGEHRFYQLLPGKPEKLVEVALFTQVWKKEEGGWRLTRVLSYDHRLTK
ncbi:MAG: nuclear transport factor 2 family protein [Steroidobacteraceae bacterium]|nr:nuclear transport factor 2 family protein [Steroidobacteraceae bacterium]